MLIKRYKPEMIQAFKASGSGWQPGMVATLKDGVKHHHLAELKI